MSTDPITPTKIDGAAPAAQPSPALRSPAGAPTAPAKAPTPHLPSSESLRTAGSHLAKGQAITTAAGMAAPAVKATSQTDKPVPAILVHSGIDVLRDDNFAPLRDRNVAVISNQTGRDSHDQRTVDVLHTAAQHGEIKKLVCIFSPEHGINGTQDSPVASGTDTETGLPVYSLYGDHRWPTQEMLKGVDTLVFDIQDAGARFYTFIGTLYYAMREAKKYGIKIVVLDRPNPINATKVRGPMMKDGVGGFTGVFELPVQHGMTVGELAGLFNDKIQMRPEDLVIVPMQGYQRNEWFDQTGIAWRDPSPNIRSINEEILYPGVGMIEAARVSVGRGTSTPFELVGAPWIQDGAALAAKLNGRNIPGVSFSAAEFVPTASEFAGHRCGGVQIHQLDRDAFDAPRLGIELASALNQINAQELELKRTAGSIGSKALVDEIAAGVDPDTLRAQWQPDLDNFLKVRQRHLIYAE